MKPTPSTIAVLLGSLTLFASPLHAATQQTAAIYAENQNFSDDMGSLRSLEGSYKVETGGTTVVLSPMVGQRITNSVTTTSTGGGVSLYQKWNDVISTRTEAFVAMDRPVFARRDFAQEVTARVAPRTTLSVGGRWAEYFGDTETTFVWAGIRHYFHGGSVAYRISRVASTGSPAIAAHLVNVTVNDGKGRGKTSLWANVGGSSLSRSEFQTGFRGDDYGVLVRRHQPLSTTLDLVVSAGMQSYAREAGRITASIVGLGLAAHLGSGRE